MKHVLPGFVAFLICVQAHASVTIKTIEYDAKTDNISLKLQFPGKCLPHEFSLIPMGQDGTTYRYYLSMTNPSDPCNAVAERTWSASMREVMNRPATVVIATNIRGESPFAIVLPSHQTITPLQVQYLGEKQALALTLRAAKNASHDRYYVEINDSCRQHGGICHATIRDSLSTNEQDHVEKIFTLPIGHLAKSTTISLVTSKGRMQIFIPKAS